MGIFPMATKEKNEEFQPVADRLKELRLDHYRVNQSSMAASVGCSLPTWSEYEGAKALPSAKVLLALIDQGISADWVLAGRGELRLGKGDIAGGIDGETIETVIKMLWQTTDEIGATITPGAAAGIVAMLLESYAASGNDAELSEKAKQLVQIANQGKAK
jgi:hypothetical protein